MGGDTPAAAPASVPAGRPFVSRAWRGFKRLLLFAVIAAIGASALYLWAATQFAYSSGERAGYVQRFSKQGWICKTWEGQLAMANLPGVTPELFAFSLRDDAVAAQINETLGSRVTLRYEQHLGLPSCFGETSYWVTSVRPITTRY